MLHIERRDFATYFEFIFIILEHFRSFKMTPYLLMLTTQSVVIN